MEILDGKSFFKVVRLQKEDHIIEVLKELRNDQNRAKKSFQHTLIQGLSTLVLEGHFPHSKLTCL